MNTLITEDRLERIVSHCGRAPYGNGVELGVYKGGSLARLASTFPDRTFYGFDTFEGLPERDWKEDELHKPGDFSDNSLEAVREFLNGEYIENVELYKGYFPEDTAKYLPDTIAFAHVDFDFYEGIKNAIEFIYPKLIPGGVMVFDDFGWPNCPGVKKALDESGLEYHPTGAEYQVYLIK